MDSQHLEKLRRFCLTVALALITVLAAGLTLTPRERIPIFGVPLAISRPALLPLGLAIASLCSAARFYYYGHMIGTSPHRKRRDFLDQLFVESRQVSKPSRIFNRKAPLIGRDVSMWHGPTEFDLFLGERDWESAKRQGDAITELFPRCFKQRVNANVKRDEIVGDDGVEYTEFDLHIVIPQWCRMTTIIEALDYSSPGLAQRYCSCLVCLELHWIFCIAISHLVIQRTASWVRINGPSPALN